MPGDPAPSFVVFVGDIAQMPTWTLGGDASDHGEPDPDALAAGWALMHLLRTRVQNITILSSQPIRRQQNLRLMSALKIPLTVAADMLVHGEFTLFKLRQYGSLKRLISQ